MEDAHHIVTQLEKLWSEKRISFPKMDLYRALYLNYMLEHAHESLIIVILTLEQN